MHDAYVDYIVELRERQADTSNMVGLTPQEQIRLTKGEEWLQRALAEARGDTADDFAAQNTNTRNETHRT